MCGNRTWREYKQEIQYLKFSCSGIKIKSPHQQIGKYAKLI